MGWWAKEIMSGDSPLDVEDEIFGVIGIQKFPEDREDNATTEDVARVLEARQDELAQNEYVKQDEIGKQVLGHVMMTYGAKPNENTVALVVSGCDEDEWASEDEERASIVKSFKETFLKFVADGGNAPVAIKRTGLLEKIGQHLAAGNTGLVNVVPPNS